MGFFDNLGKSVTTTGRSTIQKTKEMADISKLNSQITENNNRIVRLYTEIGEKYCTLHADDAEPQLANLVDAVVKMRQEIDSWNDQIQSLRGLTKCPNCGKVIPKNMVFCSGCGKRVMPKNVTPCPRCGAVVSKGVLFCPQCGSRIPAETTQKNRRSPSASASSVTRCWKRGRCSARFAAQG